MIIQVFVFVGWLHAEIHYFLLSFTLLFVSLSLYPLLFLSACHQNDIKQLTLSTISPLSLLSCPVFVFCCCIPSEWCQKRNVLPQIFSPARRFAAIKTRTFSDCFVSSYLSPSSSLYLSPSLTVLALSFSPCLSSSLPLCHSPLSPFHKSICWPTGCVTDSVLWAAWKAFVNNISALLNSVCGF